MWLSPFLTIAALVELGGVVHQLLVPVEVGVDSAPAPAFMLRPEPCGPFRGGFAEQQPCQPAYPDLWNGPVEVVPCQSCHIR